MFTLHNLAYYIGVYHNCGHLGNLFKKHKICLEIYS